MQRHAFRVVLPLALLASFGASHAFAQSTLGELPDLPVAHEPAAEEAPPATAAGIAYTAMPGVYRVGAADAGGPGLTLAGLIGFGYIESILRTRIDNGDGVDPTWQSLGDSHKRLFGSLAAAYRLLPWLTVGLRSEGRYDSHSDGQYGISTVSILQLRAASHVTPSLSLGAHVAVWLWGGDFPSFDFSSFTYDFMGLATFAPPGSRFSASAQLGFRLDNSAKSFPNPDLLTSLSNRAVLGLSAYNALLVGAAGTYQLTPTVDLVAEATMDYLLGAGVGSLSPIRFDVGTRISLDATRRVQVLLMLEVSPTGRPIQGVQPSGVELGRNGDGLTGGTSLFPIEPRFSLFGSIVWTTPAPTVVHQHGTAIFGRVVAADGGAPVPNATVRITVGDSTQSGTSGDDGHFQVDDVSSGTAMMEVTADGFSPASRNIQVSIDSVADIVVTMQRGAATGTGGVVRGVVTGDGGAPIANAQVRITNGPPPANADPFAPAPSAQHIDVTVSTDEQGRYQVPGLPAGAAVSIAVTANGATQTKPATVSATEPVRVDFQFGAGSAGGGSSVLRGRIQSFTGAPLQATIEIEQLNRTLTANADGTFEVAVPAGTYDVLVSARGHRQQRRRIRVEDNGVTVMNVDMQRGH